MRAGDREGAVKALRAGLRPDLALIDLGLPPVAHLPNEGFKLIGDLLAHAPRVRILVLTGQNEESNARRARALGAVELVPKPCDPAHLRTALARALASPRPGARRRGRATRARIVGDSPAHAQAAQPDRPLRGLVLSRADRGRVGQRQGARRLVAAPPERARATHPFLALNCAAISPTLVEPTLFGYAKGAFTGAQGAKAGYFEDAGDGTLFLDEIGELPTDLQAKLLRVLENGEYQRVGETQTRVIAARASSPPPTATCAPAIREGRFRADLYHRLSVFTLPVPPLRELGEDKLKLLDHYRAHLRDQVGHAAHRARRRARARAGSPTTFPATCAS